MKNLLFSTALTATALFAAPALAQDRTMEIEDLFQIRAVGAALMAPDGDSVAYTLFTPRDVVNGAEDGASQASLHIATGEGETRTFIQDAGGFGGVEWMPDGSALTFTARREGDDETALYALPVDGGEARRILSHETAMRSYVIASDNDTVFFIASPQVDPEVSRLRNRGFRANIFEEQHRFAEVWRASLSGAFEAEQLDLTGHPSALAISDDGGRLLVALAPTPLVDDALMERDWTVVDAATGEIVSVFETEAKIGSAAFSPDGARVAFIAGVDRADPTAGTLHIGDPNTGAFEPIAREAAQHIGDIDWIDNNTVLALASIGTESALIRYNVDGRVERRTPFTDSVMRSFDLHRGSGRIAATADAATHPRELFVSSRFRGFNRWTDHNPQLADIAFGNQRTIEYTARDGERIEGVLITPQGEPPQGGWPMIMTVHGGPEAHDADGWLNGYSRFGHIGAGDGFAVFYPNYRGSTGRGERFAKLDHLDPPGEEFWDLVDGITALSEQGLVDAERVGITGGSYGGFASAWGATIASEHFAASAPFVALTDLVSFWGTTEIPVEMVDVHFMEYPWQNWELYSQYSPTWNTQGSTTPTLILHGEADLRVDPRQSYTLYRFMKMSSDAPVRLVTYPGEGHGNRNAAAQFDYAHRVLRWMTHYLQGEGGEPPAPELDFDTLLGGDEDA